VPLHLLPNLFGVSYARVVLDVHEAASFLLWLRNRRDELSLFQAEMSVPIEDLGNISGVAMNGAGKARPFTSASTSYSRALS
jgi:hypothetical protein